MDMTPLSRDEWNHLWEYEDNREFGDPRKLILIGSDELSGGMIVLDGNVDPEPRIIWLWRDLGDELRDHGDQSFDLFIERQRENAQRT
jgi:hypothetical protein